MSNINDLVVGITSKLERNNENENSEEIDSSNDSNELVTSLLGIGVGAKKYILRNN